MKISYPSNENRFSDSREYKSLVAELNSDPNHHMVMRAHELDAAVSVNSPAVIETILKKLLLYAPRTVVVTGTYSISKAVGSPPAKAEDFLDDGFSPTMERLRELAQKLQCSNIFFLPERVTETIENWEDEEHWDSPYDFTSFDFKEAYKNPGALEVSLNDPHISRHMLEALNCSAANAAVINLWLPQLANIPSDILVRIKKDEADAFQRFHVAIRALVMERNSLTSELCAKELFQKVDHEVRAFESRMRQIAQSLSLKAYESMVGLAVVGLCFALPSEIAQIISSALGMYQTKDFVRNLFQAKEEREKVKLGDFYIPWLCTKLEA